MHFAAANLIRVGRDPGANAGSTRASVAIGFGSPAGDTGLTRLDLIDILVPHPQATFLMRVAGDAMHEFGIDGGGQEQPATTSSYNNDARPAEVAGRHL